MPGLSAFSTKDSFTLSLNAACCSQPIWEDFASYESRPGTKGNLQVQTKEMRMSLESVLVDELKDLYNAENQLVKALPKMAKGASSPELKELFTEHLEETKGQVERLKQIFELLGQRPTGKVCKGMQGLVEEGKEQLESDEEGATKDVCIAGAALRVEHYEIAGYTAAIAIARTLGQEEIVELLTENLNEEEEASRKVQEQAEPLLEEASSEGGEEEGDEEDGEDEEEEETSSSRGRTATKRASKKSTKSSSKKSSRRR
jgi:ferritin-like metal-binding protein YciE